MAIYLSDILLPSNNGTAGNNPLPRGRMYSGIESAAGSFQVPVLAVGDIVGIININQNAFLRSIKIANDDLGTTGAANLGLYRPDDGVQKAGTTLTQNGITNGPTLFATGVNLSVANGFTEYRYANAATVPPSSIILKMYELVGQNTIPSGPQLKTTDYIMAFTVTTATTAVGLINYEIVWVV